MHCSCLFVQLVKFYKYWTYFNIFYLWVLLLIKQFLLFRIYYSFLTVLIDWSFNVCELSEICQVIYYIDGGNKYNLGLVKSIELEFINVWVSLYLHIYSFNLEKGYSCSLSISLLVYNVSKNKLIWNVISLFQVINCQDKKKKFCLFRSKKESFIRNIIHFHKLIGRGEM